MVLVVDSLILWAEWILFCCFVVSIFLLSLLLVSCVFSTKNAMLDCL